MAIYSNRIEMWIDVTRSEKQKRLIIGWSSPDKTVGGVLDMTDLFLSIRNFWETTTREGELLK